MRRLAVSGFIMFVLAGVFIFGVFTTTSFAMISAFCLWTPATVFFGHSLARAGVRIVLQSEEVVSQRLNTNGYVARKVRKLEGVE